MSTLNERIRADVFQSWKLALHALQEIRIIDRRYHVLTAAEKIDLAACLSRYSKVSEEHDRIVAELMERGEEPKTVRVNLHAVIFSYYCQSDIAERLRWCPRCAGLRCAWLPECLPAYATGLTGRAGDDDKSCSRCDPRQPRHAFALRPASGGRAVREEVRQLPGVRTAEIHDAHDLFPRLLRTGLENREGAVSPRAVV